MKSILVTILLLSAVSIKAMSLAKLPINEALIKENAILAWQKIIKDFVENTDKEVADLQNKKLQDMQSVINILHSQAIELIEMAKRVRQVILVPVNNTEWGLGVYESDWHIKANIELHNQLALGKFDPLKLESLIKEFNAIPKKWVKGIIEAKMFAAMVDNQVRRLKLVVNSKLNAVKSALAKVRDSGSLLESDLKLKGKLLSIVLDEINKIDNEGPFSPKKINESIQKFAEYLLTLTADKLPKIDHAVLSEIEAPYRSYASILRSYIWGS